jgi:branched-chain amino acid aminotransferase
MLDDNANKHFLSSSVLAYFILMQYAVYNGKFVDADALLIHASNRSFRYGEGLFETIRLQNGKMPLWELHWQRLSESLPLLYFKLPVHVSPSSLQNEILQLAQKNKCADAARIRITIFKGKGGLWEAPTTSFNYMIQCWPLEKKEFVMNENGLDIGVFAAGRKACDAFSHLKSNNYQLYTLAAQYAKEQKWNECLVLNQFERICDATIANVFFIKENNIHTPQLSEGCVNGVMRKYLLQKIKEVGTSVIEGCFTSDDVQSADEIFFTNAIYGIRWVKLWGNKGYKCDASALLFKEVIAPLFKK